MTKEQVEQVFVDAMTHEDYLIGIYRLVFPDWDNIERIERWPACNEFTWSAICRMAMDWDQAHTNCFAGGAWMNNGFSCDKTIKQNWYVSLAGCNVIYKREEVA